MTCVRSSRSDSMSAMMSHKPSRSAMSLMMRAGVSHGSATVPAMTDQVPTSPATTAATGPSGTEIATYLLGLLAACVWLVALYNMFIALGEYNDQRDSFDISAPQVAQIAGEFMVATLPWTIAALAVTSVALLVGAAARRS